MHMSVRYMHDCDKCHFLGVLQDHDIYTCHDTIVARYGDGGPDYVSGDNMVSFQTPHGRVRLRFDKPGEWAHA